MPAEVIVYPIYKLPDLYPEREKKNTSIIWTVSKAPGWESGLSPFRLGPCKLYGGYRSKNMENGWQFSKVYPEHMLGNRLLDSYFKWAVEGWSNPRAIRYPMGKGRKPVFSYWDGECLPYIEARKFIYGPLYIKAVQRTGSFDKLCDLYMRSKKIYLLDYDARDIRASGETLTEVLNNPDKKMGHAFVLKMMLEEDDALHQMRL